MTERVYWTVMNPVGIPISMRTFAWLEGNTGTDSKYCTVREVQVPAEWIGGDSNLMSAEGYFNVPDPMDSDSVRVTIRNFLKTLPTSKDLSILFTLNSNLCSDPSYVRIIQRMATWNPWNTHAIEIFSSTLASDAFADAIFSTKRLYLASNQFPPSRSLFENAFRLQRSRQFSLGNTRREEDRVMVIASFLFGFGCTVGYQRQATRKPKRMQPVPQSLDEIW